MEEHLATLGLTDRYTRFPAIDENSLPGDPGRLSAGEAACFLSHARVLKAASRTGDAVHVLEDDAYLSPCSVPILDDLCESKVMDNVDLLFTETYVPLSLDILRRYKKLFDQSVRKNASGIVTSITQGKPSRPPAQTLRGDDVVPGKPEIHRTALLHDGAGVGKRPLNAGGPVCPPEGSSGSAPRKVRLPFHDIRKNRQHLRHDHSRPVRGHAVGPCNYIGPTLVLRRVRLERPRRDCPPSLWKAGQGLAWEVDRHPLRICSIGRLPLVLNSGPIG